METKQFRGGLNILPPDERDFSLGGVFGVEKDLPLEFIVTGAEKLKVKNQGSSDLCSAYALCSCSELQEEVELNPEFNFAFSKYLQGGDINSFGCDLRTASKSAVIYGSVEQQQYLLNWKSKGTTRDWKNWGEEFIKFAEPHKKQSYFRADLGIGNKFDLLKSAMYQHDSAIISGMNWKYSQCPNGIITPNDYQGMGHAITLIGWTVINEKEHLIIHNSIGLGGDNGRWYLPRDMVDELYFGNYIFVDLPRETAQKYSENGININDNWFIKLYKIIKTFLWTQFK